MGTLTKYVIPEPDSAADEGSQSHHALRSWIPQKSKEMVPLCLPDVTKGFDQAEWRIPL
jgi:DNA repair protein RadA/Sms